MGAKRNARQAAKFAAMIERNQQALNAVRRAEAAAALAATEAQAQSTQAALGRRVKNAEGAVARAWGRGRPPAVVKGYQKKLDSARKAAEAGAGHHKTAVGRIRKKWGHWL